MKQTIRKIVQAIQRRQANLTAISDYGVDCVPWWGSFEVSCAQSKFWSIGNTVVCVDRFSTEWHIAHYRGEDLGKEKLKFKTFTFNKTQDEIRIMPVLADRPLVSNLERWLYIPANENINLYISVPVWIKVATSRPEVILDEIPSVELKHTWFGANNISGKLCYAAKITVATSLDELPYSTDRIIIPIVIKNDSATVLALKKLSIPLQFLSVYCDIKQHLWTERIIISQDKTSDPAIAIKRGAPSIVKGMQLLSKPRIKPSVGVKKLFDPLIWK